MSVNKKLDGLFREVRHRYPSLPILAIAWIHATNGRNGIREEIDRVYPWVIALHVAARIPWLVARSFLFFVQVAWKQWIFRRQFREFASLTFDGIAKTWVFPENRSFGDRDFYLGDLSSQMKKRGLRLLTLSNTPYFLENHLPEICLIPPFAIFHMVVRQCKTSCVVFWNALWEQDSAMRAVLLLVSRDSLRYQTLRNGLFYWIAKEALHYWPVHFFLTIYEGVSWEKCLWFGIREAAPHCKLIGYQHTVILQESFELMNPSNSIKMLKPPEVILNTGVIPIRLMSPGHQCHGSHFVPFGSFQYSFSNSSKVCPRPTKKTLLILPEGILSEMIFLFNATLDLAKLLPEYRIVLRCHPALPFSQVRPHLKQGLDRYSNIVLSKALRIEEDFDSASVVLYRGTAAVLYAILKGLKPFYLVKGEQEENIDPLFELTAWREKILSVTQLSQHIKAFISYPEAELKKDWQKALEYVHEYVMPVEDSSYDRLMPQLH